VLVLGFSALVHAGTIDVIVNSTDEPWDPTLAGNSSYAFTNYSPGYQTGPATVNTVVSFTAGNELEITYLTGGDQTSPGEPYVDGLGYTFDEWDSSTTFNGAPGDFIPQTPIYLQEVVGTFTDGSGDIVGTPFVVGDGTIVTVPVGASALQLGINDNYYYDNSDEPDNPLQFSVSDLGNGTTQTPEPATLVLVGGGLLAIGYRRSKRHA
jgi:hypothetical protein